MYVMLKPHSVPPNHQYSSSISYKNPFPWHITPFASNPLSDRINRKYSSRCNKSNNGVLDCRARAASNNKMKAVANPTTSTTAPIRKNIKLTVSLIVQTQGGFLNISRLFKSGAITVQLVAADNYPDGKKKKTLEQDAKEGEEYKCSFDVGQEFGDIGAVILINENGDEIYLKEIHLVGLPSGKTTLKCDSWLQPTIKRIFFTNKPYISSQTPSGLIDYRKEELSALRGDGKGQRTKRDRIYDYDLYNDLGDSDKSEDLKRIVLGGSTTYPYPRRCRTGRPPSKKDKYSESRDNETIYVPRDEHFSEDKQSLFSSKLYTSLPTIENTVIEDGDLGFPYFTEIDLLFNENEDLSPGYKAAPTKILARLFDVIQKIQGSLLRFRTPELLDRDKFAWMKDEEFGRQTLAGVNPCSIQLVKEWPLKSNLAPALYGKPESAITTELVESMMDGRLTVEKAIEQKRLFVIDYHDLMLPYVEKVRTMKGRNLYGSRALFFRTPSDTLKPIAIELVRPPSGGKSQWKEAYTPCSQGTSGWLWMLAKAQFLALDTGYHQLISHWLRTHCVVEPYIIATNRQLSAMHPIYRLLKPHLKDTMAINAKAREILVNADGIVETIFSPGKYSMEMSSAAYRELWRFDQEGLPADLIRRYIAQALHLLRNFKGNGRYPTSDTDVKLTIEDYPYASDGMLLWTIIKQWVKAYVNHYYPDASHIKSDQELSNWWTEIRTVGHADKKDEPWWPKLQTTEDLVGILTTMIWIASGHHAAVNFGQYDFTAYFPNRPPLARTKMPTEDRTNKSWDEFISRPEDTILSCFPTLSQASKLALTMDVLSTHSKDEEYIGQKPEASWAENKVIMAEFELFRERLLELNKIIDERNKTMVNRSGAGVIPYTFLKTTSKEGITREGVPNSVSI